MIRGQEYLAICVPDLGGYQAARVAEVHIRRGDSVAIGAPLITLESDKTTMEIHSPRYGVVVSMLVEAGDTVSLHYPMMHLRLADVPALATTAAAEALPMTVATQQPQSVPRRLLSACYRALDNLIGAVANTPDPSRPVRCFACGGWNVQAVKLCRHCGCDTTS